MSDTATVAVHEERLNKLERTIDRIDTNVQGILLSQAEARGTRKGAIAVAGGVATFVSFIVGILIKAFASK